VTRNVIQNANSSLSNPTYAPLLCVGDLNWDVLAKPDHILLSGGDTTGRVQLAHGGSSANVAVWARRVGMPTGFLGKIGRDQFGQFALAKLEEEQIQPHIIWSEQHATGVVLVLIDSSGQRSMLTNQGADFFLLPHELPKEVIATAQHVHITAWSLFTDPPRAAALEAARIATHAGATVSFDPGSYQMIRQMGREEFKRATKALSIDIMFPNLEEGRALTGAQSPEDVLHVLREEYPQTLMCLKLDKEGAMIADSNSIFKVEATKDTVIDATGAGDSFCGAFLGHYLRSKDAKAASSLAAQVAGWVVSVFGARPEINANLEERIREYGFNPSSI
jgi:ribokinase